MGFYPGAYPIIEDVTRRPPNLGEKGRHGGSSEQSFRQTVGEGAAFLAGLGAKVGVLGATARRWFRAPGLSAMPRITNEIRTDMA